MLHLAEHCEISLVENPASPELQARLAAPFAHLEPLPKASSFRRRHKKSPGQLARPEEGLQTWSVENSGGNEQWGKMPSFGSHSAVFPGSVAAAAADTPPVPVTPKAAPEAGDVEHQRYQELAPTVSDVSEASALQLPRSPTQAGDHGDSREALVSFAGQAMTVLVAKKMARAASLKNYRRSTPVNPANALAREQLARRAHSDGVVGALKEEIEAMEAQEELALQTHEPAAPGAAPPFLGEPQTGGGDPNDSEGFIVVQATAPAGNSAPDFFGVHRQEQGTVDFFGIPSPHAPEHNPTGWAPPPPAPSPGAASGPPISFGVTPDPGGEGFVVDSPSGQGSLPDSPSVGQKPAITFGIEQPAPGRQSAPQGRAGPSTGSCAAVLQQAAQDGHGVDSPGQAREDEEEEEEGFIVAAPTAGYSGQHSAPDFFGVHQPVAVDFVGVGVAPSLSAPSTPQPPAPAAPPPAPAISFGVVESSPPAISAALGAEDDAKGGEGEGDGEAEEEEGFIVFKGVDDASSSAGNETPSLGNPRAQTPTDFFGVQRPVQPQPQPAVDFFGVGRPQAAPNAGPARTEPASPSPAPSAPAISFGVPPPSSPRGPSEAAPTGAVAASEKLRGSEGGESSEEGFIVLPKHGAGQPHSQAEAGGNAASSGPDFFGVQRPVQPGFFGAPAGVSQKVQPPQAPPHLLSPCDGLQCTLLLCACGSLLTAVVWLPSKPHQVWHKPPQMSRQRRSQWWTMETLSSTFRSHSTNSSPPFLDRGRQTHTLPQCLTILGNSSSTSRRHRNSVPCQPLQRPSTLQAPRRLVLPTPLGICRMQSGRHLLGSSSRSNAQRLLPQVP